MKKGIYKVNVQTSKDGKLLSQNIEFDVIIEEEKNVYGRDTYLITPVSGKGKAWVRNVETIES